jgi:hypothetical protein
MEMMMMDARLFANQTPCVFFVEPPLVLEKRPVFLENIYSRKLILGCAKRDRKYRCRKVWASLVIEYRE